MPATRPPPAHDPAHTPCQTAHAGPGDDSPYAPHRPTPPPAPSASIQSANTAAHDATRSGVLPDTTNVLTADPGWRRNGIDTGALLHHHMRIRPTETERRHPRPPRTPDRGHGVASVGTKNRVEDASIAGFHRVKCRFGGMYPRCTANTALIKPAIPAAASKWPKLVFTDPSAHGAPARADRSWLQRLELDRIAQHRARAMGLDVVHGVRRHITGAQRIA